MDYLNSRNEIRLGHVVTTGKQKDAERFIIKRIASDDGMVYIVPLFEDKSGGFWVSSSALFFVS